MKTNKNFSRLSIFYFDKFPKQIFLHSQRYSPLNTFGFQMKDIYRLQDQFRQVYNKYCEKRNKLIF